jgi:hypothetical protein
MHLLQELGGNEGLAKTYDISEENAVELLQFLQGLNDGLLLVLQFHETVRQVGGNFILKVNILLHIFIDELQIQEFPDGAAQPSESLKFVHRSVAGSENILLTAA